MEDVAQTLVSAPPDPTNIPTPLHPPPLLHTTALHTPRPTPQLICRLFSPFGVGLTNMSTEQLCFLLQSRTALQKESLYSTVQDQ